MHYNIVLQLFAALNIVRWYDTTLILTSIVSVAHKKSPFVVLFGRESTLPLDLAISKLFNCTV